MADTAPSFKLIKELTRKEIVFALAHVPGGRRVLFGGSDFHIYDVDLALDKPEPRRLGGHESYVTGLTIAGSSAISGGYDGRLIWWDLKTGDRIRTVEAHSKWIRAVEASADGSVIASVADDMVCRLWDPKTGAKLREMRGHAPITPHHFSSMLYACAFSPDGRYVATGDKVGHVVIWEVATGKSAATLEVPALYTWDPIQRLHSIGGIRTLAFSPDGHRLAIGGIGHVGNIDGLEGPPRVEVFDWQKGQRTVEFPGESAKGIVERLVFSDDRHILAVGGASVGFLMRYDLNTKTVVQQEKVKPHLHDVIRAESEALLFSVGHGRVMLHEWKV